MKFENDFMVDVLMVISTVGFLVTLGAAIVAVYKITFFED